MARKMKKAIEEAREALETLKEAVALVEGEDSEKAEITEAVEAKESDAEENNAPVAVALEMLDEAPEAQVEETALEDADTSLPEEENAAEEDEVKAEENEVKAEENTEAEATLASQESESTEASESIAPSDESAAEEPEAIEEPEAVEKESADEESSENTEKAEETEEEALPVEDGEEIKEEPFEEKPQMTEEEIRDARYLPRPSVIYDENAHDAEAEEEASEDGDEPEIYSLRFFDEEDSDTNVTVEEDEEEEKEQEPYNPDKPRRVDARFDFVELFVFTLVFVLIVTSFILRHSVVVGGSMENTLLEGERLLISDLFYTPDYGDIIVFQDAETNIKGAIVKRVIGLPGDVIEIRSNGSIYRNDVLLIEEYVFIDGKNYQENELFVVPEGEYFVMGDHRNNSEDSRSFGTIKEESILGRVLLRFYPFDKFGKVE